jgi:putative ABC transport system ATP-binding protein
MSQQVVAAAHEVVLRYGDTVALRGATLELHAGERVALMGPSGSGKSSLLHCLAGVVLPQEGRVEFEGARLDQGRESARSALRLRRMGMVFQFGDLVPELTLVENVMLPLQVLGQRRGPARTAAMELLDRLGVADVATHRTGAVAGGQAQRAAVARALVHRPAVVFADEPTGSLDSVTAEKVLDAMVSLTAESGAALLVVTHDNIVAAHLQRHVVMSDGVVSVSPLAPAEALR